MKLKNILSICILLWCINDVFSQKKQGTGNIEFEYYGALTHQHHNFYNKPFSYTGIETGVILNHYFLTGLYGSTFLSVFKTANSDTSLFLQMRQIGLALGMVTNDTTRIHGGFLFNIGYIAISAEHDKFSLLNSGEKTIQNGLILVPQIFGETNLTRWMRFRAGIAYDFYFLNKKDPVALKEIRNVSFNFGLIFGSFRDYKSWFR